MFLNNSFGSLVVKDQTLSDMSKLGGSGELGTIGAAMKHEGSGGSGFPVFRPEICDDASGRDLSAVIQREFNGYGAEEIVKEHSVADVTPSRLEEKMNMLHLACHSAG